MGLREAQEPPPLTLARLANAAGLSFKPQLHTEAALSDCDALATPEQTMQLSELASRRRDRDLHRGIRLPDLMACYLRTVATRTPSFFLLVPGPWTSAAAIRKHLARAGVHTQLWTDDLPDPGGVRVDMVHDPQGFGGAMSHGRSGEPPPAVIDAASNSKNAALIEVARTLSDDTAATARLSRALRDAGGVAVRMESSGAASTWDTWLDQLGSGDSMQLVGAATVLVGGDGMYFSCGMHAFDLPDAQVQHSDATAALEWLEALCAYQVAESPTLISGDTFRPDEHTPRRVLERWPDHRHVSDDGRHNPFGLWRALDRADDPISAENPCLVFVPSLAAVLTAAETQQGHSLTRTQVEALTEAATVIAMEPKDAVAMERSRGYADLQPQRVWAQWNLLFGA